MKKKKKKLVVPVRMNIIFFVVFLLFSSLIFRLGVVQIVHGEKYKNEIKKTSDVTIQIPVPRGKILDRNGNLIVGNKPLKAITYTRPTSIKPEEMLGIAEKLAKFIKKDTKEDLKAITERDRKDFWILHHQNEAKSKITKQDEKSLKQKKLAEKDYDKEIYHLMLERITEQEMNSFSKKDLEILAIYREMLSGYPLTPQIIKNKNVTKEEIAIIAENLDALPGVDITTDWDRYNSYKIDGFAPLATILGKITTAKEGLPSEKAEYYSALGYSRNDRVGKSYLEYQYEDVLRGKKEKIENKMDKSGKVIDSVVVRKGQRGNDLVLSVDMEFQKKVEEIITNKLSHLSQPYLDRTFVTVMNPNTGEILAMAGKLRETNEKTGAREYNDFALGNMITSYAMGSAVKGAMVLTGYQTGAITMNNRVIRDEPLVFKDTKSKSSWSTSAFGDIDDLYALKRSSNVYMFKLAMRIGGQQYYIPNGSLSIDKVKAIDTLRYNFAQFGLGVKTGIDLPGEQVGFGGRIPDFAGNVLDFGIGQFDTYTPLQLVQYISTIANGGSRIRPHLVKEIREPSDDIHKLGPVAHELGSNVLNKIGANKDEIKRVKEGLRLVVYDPNGTGYGSIKNKQLKIAGKTGTAEALYDGPVPHSPGLMLWNLTFAGYAPYDNPEIALSVVVPWSTTDKMHPNLDIADDVFKAYFDLKKKREKKDTNSPNKIINIKKAEKEQNEIDDSSSE
ncbi:penicillin-binding protein [Heyndrickxia sporothermodurans]|uniref:serine-type D-Ala-D-Ala carboxypeptidase n=1 Tax=Heyndrickxia sporothermodurans TaxID=46224 RepID=A0AB37H8R1_9BACI|nr:penicillin-binding protein 2 [Heyndrickxia sporothermodurans]MBL5766067.1 penicillin-binding protein 2 [Heyndrickxia sporothermodurans]MBL5769508.1 penicillin-binding protein 2 [Heyndrickxia sporothermodurans]MBL5773289.1 penicillin-binding protein 2 [Heyndrickxia sporothermodurans]MBL5777082.1 penicillin-binding protein 2 [Heyndrickxia sporothermodurans]MBL5780490.1 penicillin-binding protein 2 [Heyndrickxia sporothermodurans]